MSQSADPRFSNVVVQYQTLKSQLTAGALTPEQFETALQALMILDEQGRYWMMGAESGRWYVYEAQAWVQRDPPGMTPAAPAPPTAASAALRPDAVTLTSFAPPQITQPPQPSPMRPDQATTLVGFTPPQIPVQPPQTGAVPPAAPPLDEPAKRGGLSPVLLMAGLFLVVCVVGVIALGVAAISRFGQPAELPTTAPIVVQTQAPLAATATLTPVPPATATTTRAPSPTVAPTTAPQRTPPVIVIPSALPTVRPLPTVAPPTPTPQPLPTATDTPEPPPPTATRTPVPQFSVTFAFQGYERWGRPDKDNCSIFNNKEPVRQFKWDVFVTNRSANTLNPDEWTFAAFNDANGEARTCFASLPPVPAGLTGKATFVAFVESNQFVSRITHRIRNASFQRCLDPAWKEVPC